MRRRPVILQMSSGISCCLELLRLCMLPPLRIFEPRQQNLWVSSGSGRSPIAKCMIQGDFQRLAGVKAERFSGCRPGLAIDPPTAPLDQRPLAWNQLGSSACHLELLFQFWCPYQIRVMVVSGRGGDSKKKADRTVTLISPHSCGCGRLDSWSRQPVAAMARSCPRRAEHRAVRTYAHADGCWRKADSRGSPGWQGRAGSIRLRGFHEPGRFHRNGSGGGPAAISGSTQPARFPRTRPI